MFNFSAALNGDAAYEANQALERRYPIQESLSSIDSPRLSIDPFRESSVGLSMCRWSPDSTASPVESDSRPLTPANLETQIFHDRCSWPRAVGKNYWQLMSQEANCDNPEANGSLWMYSEPEVLSDEIDDYGFSRGRMLPTKTLPQRTPSQSQFNPLLKKAVLSRTVVRSSSLDLDSHGLQWGAYCPGTKVSRARCETSDPSITFCNDTVNSPIAPLRSVLDDLNSLYRTPTSSACDTQDIACSHRENSAAYELKEYSPCSDTGSIAGRDRPSSRSNNSHRTSSSRSSSRVKTGMECESYIRQNEHACTVPGCVDKTGKPKRFKRSEHRKRHEKTVHGKDDPEAPNFACWVKCGDRICGRMFSRNDNLKSHLLKTHGRKSPNQRNLYVATLDRYSEYCDFAWTGPLNKDGLPLGHPLWPEVRQ